ncbi:MAG: DNA gyrase inhibitor YacG [Pseudomonadota bacterium]
MPVPEPKPARSRRSGASTQRCPTCGRPSDPALKPFCSKRCRDVDLARWLTGAYAIPVVEADEPDDDAG